MKHPHAENMRLYAEDAMETDTPWERWEYHFTDVWRPCVAHPNWDNYTQYRRKPQPVKRPYIRIGKRWVPDPMRQEPAVGTSYVIAVTLHGVSPFGTDWRDADFDKTWLKAGVCHLTREAAEAHLAALQELHAQAATMLTDEEAKQ